MIRYSQPNGTCPDYQPDDLIVMPGAAGFESECNRLISRLGWRKHEVNDPLAGSTPWGVDDMGHECRVVENRKRSPGQSKYGILYRIAPALKGKEVEVFKDPIDDHGKISKKGRLALHRRPEHGLKPGELTTVSQCKSKEFADRIDQMQEVFRDGKMLVNYTLADVRNNAKIC